jgi:asparagine synthetase B (glutamine-hydrolysing)
MCGILALLQLKSKDGTLPEWFDALRPLLAARGPDDDYGGERRETTRGGHGLTLVSAVLALRGREPAAQPLEDGGYTLLWNGEVFGGMDHHPGESCGFVCVEYTHSNNDYNDCNVVSLPCVQTHPTR